MRLFALFLVLATWCATANAEEITVPLGQELRGEVFVEATFGKINSEMPVVIRITEYEPPFDACYAYCIGTPDSVAKRFRVVPSHIVCTGRTENGEWLIQGALSGYLADSAGKIGVAYDPWVGNDDLAILEKTKVVLVVDQTRKFTKIDFSRESLQNDEPATVDKDDAPAASATTVEAPSSPHVDGDSPS